MEVEINAGLKVDIPSRAEIKGIVDGVRTSWMAEVSQGDRYPRWAMFGTISGGSITVGNGPQDRIGPAPGFVWSISRINVSTIDTSADAVSLYLNDTGDSNRILTFTSNYQPFNQRELVLFGGDQLIVFGTTAETGKVWVTGQARELPVSLAWRL